MKKLSFTYFLVCEGLSNDDFGVARDTVVLVSKSGDFFEEKLGGLYRRTALKG